MRGQERIANQRERESTWAITICPAIENELFPTVSVHPFPFDQREMFIWQIPTLHWDLCEQMPTVIGKMDVCL